MTPVGFEPTISAGEGPQPARPLGPAKYRTYAQKMKIILQPLKGLFSEIDVFSKKSRTLLLRPLISFVMSWAQSVIECNAETKQLHPTRLTQGSVTYHCFFTVHFYDSILLQSRGIRLPINSGLMTVLSEPGHLSAFGNCPPSLFNDDQQQICCFVHGSKIVNYHNAVAEDIPFIWQKIERNLT